MLFLLCTASYWLLLIGKPYLSRYELPQYGSRRKLISPSGLYDEYGEVVVDDDGSYYYSPQESDGEVKKTNKKHLDIHYHRLVLAFMMCKDEKLLISDMY